MADDHHDVDNHDEYQSTTAHSVHRLRANSTIMQVQKLLGEYSSLHNYLTAAISPIQHPTPRLGWGGGDEMPCHRDAHPLALALAPQWWWGTSLAAG